MKATLILLGCVVFAAVVVTVAHIVRERMQSRSGIDPEKFDRR